MIPDEYLAKKIISPFLKQAIIKAREASKAQKDFQTELKKYIGTCEKHKLTPKLQWLNLLQWLAEGRDMMDILEELQIFPTSISFLEILESLQAHQFPDDFLNSLISEIPIEYLDDKRKEKLRQRLQLKLQ